MDKTFEKLVELEMDGSPKSFSRPVELDGRKTDAKFRTVTVRAGVFPEGRFISVSTVPRNLFGGRSGRAIETA